MQFSVVGRGRFVSELRKTNFEGSGFLKSGGALALHLHANIRIMYIMLNRVIRQNLYGAFMSTVTVIEPFAALKVTPRVRAGFMLVICAVATALCTLAQDDFIQLFLNFIFFMSYFLIPWTAINLVDYYALRKGIYQIADIFEPSGIYGRVNWIAIGVFLATIYLRLEVAHWPPRAGSFLPYTF